jgi:hypothetical protein
LRDMAPSSNPLRHHADEQMLGDAAQFHPTISCVFL